MTKNKKILFCFIITVFLLSLLVGFFTFDELQRREKFALNESRSLANVAKIAEFIHDYQNENESSASGSAATDLTAIAGAIAPLLKADSTPPAPTDADAETKKNLRERYDKFSREETLMAFPYYPINRIDNLPLLALFLVVLGVIASSFGSLVMMARGGYGEKNTHFDLFKLWLMPIFGGVTSLITGLILFFSTKSDLKILSGLNLEFAFVSVPIPIYILSFMLALNPLHSLTALFSFLRNHWGVFHPDYAKVEGDDDQPTPVPAPKREGDDGLKP